MKRKRFAGKEQNFWDKEYKTGNHLALSEKPSEDLVKFTRWLLRQYGREYLNPTTAVLDLGCGNGRNLIYLAKTFGIKGVGYDISEEALARARRAGQGLPLTFETRSVAGPLPLSDNSQTLALDMMTSHLFNAEERTGLREEIFRVIKPDGWLFWKTFLLNEDRHAKRLLRENPATEAGSYIHPEIGLAEHVFTEEEISTALRPSFTIRKIAKSHRHREPAGGKRRSVSIYAQKLLPNKL